MASTQTRQHDLHDYMQSSRVSVIEESYVKYSTPLDPKNYEGEDYFCKFTPRIHKNAILADKGSWQCHEDFLEANYKEHGMNQGKEFYAVGCINDQVGNFAALCGCEGIPERLELISYMLEYTLIYDDVIEYTENKNVNQLQETNRAHFEGLTGGSKTGTKENVRKRHLQAKMATQLLDFDAQMGKASLDLWKEMSETFVNVRDPHYKSLDEYLAFRIVEAGCHFGISLICLGMDFWLSEEEKKLTENVTMAAFHAWVLVNDYFSFDKEYQNRLENHNEGKMVNAVSLYTQWHDIGPQEAKQLLKGEIIAREQRFVDEKAVLNARGLVTTHIAGWFNILDNATGGNFAWSMTTARYRIDVENPYIALREACPISKDDPEKNTGTKGSTDSDTVNDAIPSRDSEPSSTIVTQSQVLNSSSTPSPTSEKGDHGDSLPLSPTPPSPPSSASSPLSEHKHETKALTFLDYAAVQGPLLPSYSEVVLEPGEYVRSLPSKNVRNSVIDALEVWYQIPEKSLVTIREMVELLHSASLMIDDIQDKSELRRGFPSTHTVFGTSRTINAANLMMMQAVKCAQSLSPVAVSIVIDRLIEGHLGQGMDIYWTAQYSIPTMADYFSMVDGKTGAFFTALADVMRSEATTNRDLDLTTTTQLVGRFFQTRDDYQNLTADAYTSQKGFAEDLSEGKLSLPVLHTLSSPKHRGRLQSVLRQRTADGLSVPLRKVALGEIRAAGGLEFAHRVVLQLQEKLWKHLGDLEAEHGENWILRLVVKRLEIV